MVRPTSAAPYTRPLGQIDRVYTPSKIGSTRFMADFDRPDGLTGIIEAVGFCQKKYGISPEKIVAGGRGRREFVIIEYAFGREIATHEVVRQLGVGLKCSFCPPLAAIEYVRAVKKKRLESPLAIIAFGPGSLCRMVVGNIDGGLFVEIDYAPDNYHFPEDTVFLAIDRSGDSRG